MNGKTKLWILMGRRISNPRKQLILKLLIKLDGGSPLDVVLYDQQSRFE